ncbi:MAG: phytanoyl-CoA dioxygenase family protein [Verrucomicrobiota bacterium]
MTDFETEGFEIHPGILTESRVRSLRREVDQLAHEIGQTCVRGIATKSEKIAELSQLPEMTNLLPSGHSLVRSILFDKTPSQNWPVGWHQDQTVAVSGMVTTEGYTAWTKKDGFFQVRPPLELLESMTTLRIHLDEAGADNGPLRVVPGSHLGGIKNKSGDNSLNSHFECHCHSGDVLRMRPLLVHSSKRATIPHHRRIIHLEFANRDALSQNLEWAE